jgi:hypothetical protein
MDDMIKEISWEEFRSSGMLWFTNNILHTFGMAIATEYDDDGKFVRAYPARVKYRGFTGEINDKGYYDVSKYLKENISELLSECDVPEGIDNV